MYLGFLETHKASYKSVIEHTRDHPDKPFLFHCTGVSLVPAQSPPSLVTNLSSAGKDRTGTLALLILHVAGVSMDAINLDYTLTRVGIEPIRDLVHHQMAARNPVDTNDPAKRAVAEIPQVTYSYHEDEMN